MLTDEQIKVATDWWASLVSRNHEDLRDPLREALATNIRKAARERGEKFRGNDVLVCMSQGPNIILFLALAGMGIRSGYNKILPEYTEMGLAENGRVWVRHGERREIEELLAARGDQDGKD